MSKRKHSRCLPYNALQTSNICKLVPRTLQAAMSCWIKVWIFWGAFSSVYKQSGKGFFVIRYWIKNNPLIHYWGAKNAIVIRYWIKNNPVKRYWGARNAIVIRYCLKINSVIINSTKNVLL